MATGSALVRKSLYSLRNLGVLLRGQSSFKILFILCFATAFEAGLFLLFVDGFRFLDALGGAGVMIIGRLFSLFFLGMGSMLILSGIVTAYSTLFRSDEVPFLLVRPFSISEVVLYKASEAAALSSWAFFFIAIPFVGAYAWHGRLSPLFALWTLLFSVPFLVLCAGVGTLVTLLIVRWTPMGRAVRVLGPLAGIAACFYAWHISRVIYSPSQFQFNISKLIPGLGLASNPLLPNWWMAEGIMSLGRGQIGRGLMLWGVTFSSALAMLVVVEWMGSHLFYNAWQRVIGSGSRPAAAPVLFRRIERGLRFLATDVRALILKDMRTFVRDPVQWSQALIFFGLLAIYFANLRTFRYHALPTEWRNAISFVNVFSVSAVICSLGSRFVYPQLSLEGHGFWIVGLSPTTTTRVLLTKFAVALCTMVGVSVLLMLLSAAMLRSPPLTRVVAVSLAACIAAAVCGLSSGLGGIFLDLKHRNPAAIVSGFGGTLNLVLSLAFMLSAILPFGLLFHMQFMGRISTLALHRGLALAGLWLLAITAAAIVLPLALAARSLARRDF